MKRFFFCLAIAFILGESAGAADERPLNRWLEKISSADEIALSGDVKFVDVRRGELISEEVDQKVVGARKVATVTSFLKKTKWTRVGGPVGSIGVLTLVFRKRGEKLSQCAIIGSSLLTIEGEDRFLFDTSSVDFYEALLSKLGIRRKTP